MEDQTIHGVEAELYHAITQDMLCDAEDALSEVEKSWESAVLVHGDCVQALIR